LHCQLAPLPLIYQDLYAAAVVLNISSVQPEIAYRIWFVAFLLHVAKWLVECEVCVPVIIECLLWLRCWVGAHSTFSIEVVGVVWESIKAEH
jgi:hypothetical protein